MDGDVVQSREVALDTLAVAAVGIGEDGHLALAVAAYDRECVLEGQAAEVDREQLLHPFLGQVAALAHVDQAALDQVIALGVRVVDVVVVDADLKQTGDRGFAHLVDGRQLGQAFGQVLADRGFLGAGAQGQQGGQQAGRPVQGVLHVRPSKTHGLPGEPVLDSAAAFDAQQAPAA
jgi:hypothetical protein